MIIIFLIWVYSGDNKAKGNTSLQKTKRSNFPEIDDVVRDRSFIADNTLNLPY